MICISNFTFNNFLSCSHCVIWIQKPTTYILEIIRKKVGVHSFQFKFVMSLKCIKELVFVVLVRFIHPYQKSKIFPAKWKNSNPTKWHSWTMLITPCIFVVRSKSFNTCTLDVLKDLHNQYENTVSFLQGFENSNI